MKRALFAVLITMMAAAAAADDGSTSTATVCSADAPVLADPQDDAALLQHLYGATQRLRIRHTLAEPATQEITVARTAGGGRDEFRLVRERRAVRHDGRVLWLVILDGAPVRGDAQNPRIDECADCRRQSLALLLQPCAGGWQAPGPAQALAAGGGFATESSYRFLPLGENRIGILQQWKGPSLRGRRELQALFALDADGRVTRVLDLLRRFEDDDCGADANTSGDDAPAACRDTLNRIEPPTDASSDWPPLQIRSRYLDEHGQTRETGYRLEFRNGQYGPESGELAPRLRPDFGARRATP
ncbi:hypothetical protein ACFJIW_15395 [Tahibacter sp. UC22_41]|uniref:hypothetical protein n=1 Tax=Tahibacter sp. UC22_41 TaxID=3350178 RepID=UPI0036DA7653